MRKLISLGGAIIGLLIPGLAIAAMNAAKPDSGQIAPGYSQPVAITGAPAVGGALPVITAHGWTTVYIANVALTSTVMLNADGPNGVTIRNGWTTTYIASSANLPVTISHGWTTVYVASVANAVPTVTVFQAGTWSMGATIANGWTTVYVASTENNLPTTTVFQAGTWTVNLANTIPSTTIQSMPNVVLANSVPSVTVISGPSLTYHSFATFTATHTGTWRDARNHKSVCVLVSMAVGGGRSATLYVSFSSSTTGTAPLDESHGIAAGSAIVQTGIYTFEPMGDWYKLRIDDSNGATVTADSTFRPF